MDNRLNREIFKVFIYRQAVLILEQTDVEGNEKARELARTGATGETVTIDCLSPFSLE